MNDLDKTFKRLQNDFDLAEPNVGHFERFEAKLKGQDEASKKSTPISWYWLAIEASIILLVGVWVGNNNAQASMQLG